VVNVLNNKVGLATIEGRGVAPGLAQVVSALVVRVVIGVHNKPGILPSCLEAPINHSSPENLTPLVNTNVIRTRLRGGEDGGQETKDVGGGFAPVKQSPCNDSTTWVACSLCAVVPGRRKEVLAKGGSIILFRCRLIMGLNLSYLAGILPRNTLLRSRDHATYSGKVGSTVRILVVLPFSLMMDTCLRTNHRGKMAVTDTTPVAVELAVILAESFTTSIGQCCLAAIIGTMLGLK
jgi:hypothetical protein